MQPKLYIKNEREKKEMKYKLTEETKVEYGYTLHRI